jgi:hypothetical protein
MATPEEMAAAAERVIRSGFADLSTGDERSFSPHPEAALTEPIALYTVDTGRLGDNRDASALVQIGWRIIIHDSQGGVKYADAAGNGDDLRFARLVEGPRVDAMIEAGEQAQRLARRNAGPLRVVETSRLKVGALWLGGEPSMFVPFAGLSGAPIGETEFLSTLADRSARLMDAAGGAPAAAGGEVRHQRAKIWTGPPLRTLVLGGIGVAAAAVGGLGYAVVRLGNRLRQPIATESDQDDDGPTAGTG